MSELFGVFSLYSAFVAYLQVSVSQLTSALGPLLEDNVLLLLKSNSALDMHRRGMKIKIFHL